MKKILAVSACIILAAVLLCSCGNSEKEEETVTETTVNDTAVLGTWTEDYFDSGFIFRDDGTGYDTFWNLDFTYTANGKNLILHYDSDVYGVSQYSYSVSGNELTMKRVDTSATETFVYTKQPEKPSEPETETSPGNAVPAEGEMPVDGEAPIEGEAPAEAQAPEEG